MAGVKVTANTNGISYVNGVINGVSTGIQDKTFVGSVLKYAHSKLTYDFGLWMDALALMNPSSLMHVYEWNQLGKPGGRLWENMLRGRGADRTDTVIWKASKKTVPVPPALLTPGPTGKSVKDRIHIFYWKAPVMEMGLTVTIEPKLAANLAFLGNQGGIKFYSKPVQMTAGGGKTTGQFTKAYFTYWNSVAQTTMSNTLNPQIQGSVATTVQPMMKSRRVSAVSVTSAMADYRKGENVGRLGLAKLKRKYDGGAAARRALLYGS